MVTRGYNNFLVGRLVRYGASVEHGPEIYGVYLCNNLDKVNRGDNSASLFMGVDSTFQYFDVEAATADWRGAVRPNPYLDLDAIEYEIVGPSMLSSQHWKNGYDHSNQKLYEFHI